MTRRGATAPVPFPPSAGEESTRPSLPSVELLNKLTYGKRGQEQRFSRNLLDVYNRSPTCFHLPRSTDAHHAGSLRRRRRLQHAAARRRAGVMTRAAP